MAKLYTCDFDWLRSLPQEELDAYFKDMPVAGIKGDGQNLVELLQQIGLQKSKSEIKRLIKAGGVNINGVRGSLD